MNTSSVHLLILKMQLKLNLNTLFRLCALVYYFQLSIGYSQSNCDYFLTVNKVRVENLTKIAQNSHSFWRKNYKLLSIALPEYLSESENEVESEIQIFKTINLFENNLIEKISLGPLQMQPIFIHQVIRNSPRLNNRFHFSNERQNFDLIQIRNNIDSFVSLDFQLDILKSFIINESQKLKKKPLNCLKELSQIYNGSIQNNTKKKIIIFTKLYCEKKTYSDWATFLCNYYFK